MSDLVANFCFCTIDHLTHIKHIKRINNYTTLLDFNRSTCELGDLALWWVGEVGHVITMSTLPNKWNPTCQPNLTPITINIVSLPPPSSTHLGMVFLVLFPNSQSQDSSNSSNFCDSNHSHKIWKRLQITSYYLYIPQFWWKTRSISLFISSSVNHNSHEVNSISHLNKGFLEILN